MPRPYIDRSHFEGKTIKTINVEAVNCMMIYFTDGTAVLLETENVGHGIFGIVEDLEFGNHGKKSGRTSHNDPRKDE